MFDCNNLTEEQREVLKKYASSWSYGYQYPFTFKKLAKICGVGLTSINKICDPYEKPSFIKPLEIIGFGVAGDPYKVTIETAIAAIEYFRNKGKFTQDGCLIANLFYQAGYAEKKNKNSEKFYQVKLCKELQGLIEVKCLFGTIDILTDKEIIEVKKITDWKTALGQILAYSQFYPEHKKRIHLFGRQSNKFLVPIEKCCARFGVVVTYERI